MAFSPDGKTLAAAGGGFGSLCQLWDVATGRQIGHGLGSGAGGRVAFSPDGKTLATEDGNGTVWLWDVATGRRIGHGLKTRLRGSIRWRSARTARRW